MSTRHVEALEAYWTGILRDAGAGEWMSCSTDGKRLSVYFANIDRLVGERQAELCGMIKAAREDPRQPYGAAYVDGIEAAMHRAIASPRQAA